MSRPRTPKWKTATLILDQGQPLARVDAALWPPVGAVVDHPDRNRLARVASVRLSLRHEPSTALILIDLESGGV
jgi:hypothetical protein